VLFVLLGARAVSLALRAERLARYDGLTGLLNRSAFTALVEEAAAQPDAAGSSALLFLDLDGFKAVNDSAGHAAGDVLLGEVARRLTSAVRRGDVVARLGGDEFAVLLTRLPAPGAAEATATRVLALLREPVVVDGTPHRIGASIGVLRGLVSTDVGQLLATADSAMYAAKSRGGYRAAVWTPELSDAAQWRGAAASSVGA
jgi:diguanylate cyclase (GGDEF)-like protein